MFETGIGEDREHSSSFCYISVPLYALKELWLSERSRNWISKDAIIQSCHYTLGGYKETIRVEVWYGYEVDGEHYAGRLIRDRVFGSVQEVVRQYPEGGSATVRVNPVSPAQSYLHSGLGYFEPFFVGLVSLGTIGILLFIIIALVIAPVFDHFAH